jgi:hypothetical protein
MAKGSLLPECFLYFFLLAPKSLGGPQNGLTYKVGCKSLHLHAALLHMAT